MDYEEAEYFYGLAYQKKPEDDMLILSYAHLLRDNQQIDKARNILEKSLK